jgi:hypothetical protein
MRSRFARELDSCDRPLSLAELQSLGVTRRMVRGPGWRRTSYGFWAPARGDFSPAQRILDASPLVGPTDAMTGWAAAYASGVDALDGLDSLTMRPLPVPIVVGGRAGRELKDAVTYLRSSLPADDAVELGGLRFTTPVRAAFDGARTASGLEEAVAFVDACAHAGVLALDALRSYVTAHPGWKGIQLARSASELADAAARSTWESRLRVFCMYEADLPRPLVNQPIFDRDGRLLGIPDLLDEEAGVATEFDGQDHRTRTRHRADNVREETFESSGLVVTRADSLDLLHHRPALRSRLRDAHRRGMTRDRSRDRWTIEAPSWWIEHHGVPVLTEEEKAAVFGRW